MKIISTLVLAAVSVTAAPAQETRSAPQPRPKLDPVSREAVVMDAPKAEPATAASAPVVMDRYVVRGYGGVPRQTPKQEVVTGPFSVLKGGKIAEGKLGGARYEVGVWPMLDFDRAGSMAAKGGGIPLKVDFLRITW